jgi:hypothetical protein
MKYTGNIIRNYTVIISISLLTLSFTQTSYCTDTLRNGSLFVFLFGIFGFFKSWAGLSWLANPLLFLSWVAAKKSPKTSTFASLLACILSLSFMFFSEVMDNEGGYMNKITSLGWGYWLWTISIGFALISNIVGWFHNQKKTIEDL